MLLLRRSQANRLPVHLLLPFLDFGGAAIQFAGLFIELPLSLLQRSEPPIELGVVCFGLASRIFGRFAGAARRCVLLVRDLSIQLVFAGAQSGLKFNRPFLAPVTLLCSSLELFLLCLQLVSIFIEPAPRMLQSTLAAAHFGFECFEAANPVNCLFGLLVEQFVLSVDVLLMLAQAITLGNELSAQLFNFVTRIGITSCPFKGRLPLGKLLFAGFEFVLLLCQLLAGGLYFALQAAELRVAFLNFRELFHQLLLELAKLFFLGSMRLLPFED